MATSSANTELAGVGGHAAPTRHVPATRNKNSGGTCVPPLSFYPLASRCPKKLSTHRIVGDIKRVKLEKSLAR
jgi:hypothetical protein